MAAQPKKRTVLESGDGGLGLGLAAFIANGEDLGPIIRHAFESGKPEALMQNLRSIVKKKEVEIEELCRLHYEDFILAVDELRGVLVDADELKSMLTEAKFHPALKTLDLIEKGYLQNIPLKLLKKVVAKHIPLIKMHIEKKVCSEFNDWLVHIRRMAKQIGQVSISQASLARQKDEEMRVQHREAEEHSDARPDGHTYTLDVENTDEESTLNFDLTPVYRAHHMHIRLGIGEKFRDYYYKNRLMQLNLDMQISTSQPFLESHQPLLAQVAGFFIVEQRVLRSADGLLSESQVETTWETAVAKITSILEDQFARMSIASHLLLVKDYVTLLGTTVSKYGYQITQLIQVIEKNKDKYHQLLLIECRKKIEDILGNDSYEQMIIKKEYEYNMNVTAFHFEPDDVIPEFPYMASFSSGVPDVCRIVRSFIEDSISYLSYSGRMNYEVVKGYLDRLLIEVLNNSLLNMIYARSLAMSQMMQLAGNISVLEQACDMFLLFCAHLCGIPKRIAQRSHSGLTAKAVLKASQNAAYNALINLANFKIDEFMVLLDDVNWIVEEAPDNPNDYMNEVLIYLETLVSTAQAILPLEALYKVVSGAVSHISDSIMTTLLNDGVKRFTVNAVMGIDIDLKLLEAFVDDKFQSTGLADLGKETTFADCLVEIRQLVNLLLSSQPENFMNPVIRMRNYGSLDYKKVAIVCDKYKDFADGLFGSLSNRNKQDARKKSMDVLKRRLKDFS
ncbi:exocyst complex component SEC15A-like isoform X2 [Oryza brachyantha]|uniref:exocyst complex component SEC15A-like isoform X2 n=1 Tax=Oryza brachyantha TaxID=4533 RepID=UPI0007766E6E|nr:exocyst complex component SEC15A-like isoform X2 [Oryza brachyantha]